MGRGLSQRMRFIMSLISSSEADAHYVTIREIIAKAGRLDGLYGEPYGKYLSAYRSTHRTMRLMEKRGLIVRHAKLNDGTILWGLSQDKVNH